MLMDAALATALRTDAAPAERSAALLATAAALRSIAESRHRQEPPVPLASDMDLAAAVDALCSVFGELEQHRAAAEYDCVASAAVAVVGVLPTFAAVTDHIAPSQPDPQSLARPRDSAGHLGRPPRDAEHADMLDKVMGLIIHVTEYIFFALTTVRVRCDVSVDPLRCLIQGWQAAFRGKADCLAVVDRLSLALLNHDGCRSDGQPGSAQHQQTVDVFSCILAAFESTAGTDFQEWVVKTPYWVTLLNVAARYVCDFEPADLVNGTMPACHDAGVLLLKCLRADARFSILCGECAVSLSNALVAWCRLLPQPDWVARCPGSCPALFVPSTAPSGCAPRPDWITKCPSQGAGAVIVAGLLACSVRMQRDHTEDMPRFFLRAAVNSSEEESGVFWPLPAGDSLTVAATAASWRAAMHFVEMPNFHSPSALQLGMWIGLLPRVAQHLAGVVPARVVDESFSAFAFCCRAVDVFGSDALVRTLVTLVLNIVRTPEHFAASTISECWAVVNTVLRQDGVVDTDTARALLPLAVSHLDSCLHCQGTALGESLVRPPCRHVWKPLVLAQERNGRSDPAHHVMAAAAQLCVRDSTASEHHRRFVDLMSEHLRTLHNRCSELNLRHPTSLVSVISADEFQCAATFSQVLEACSTVLTGRVCPAVHAQLLGSVYDVLMELASQANARAHPFDRMMAQLVGMFVKQLPFSTLGAERLKAAWDFAVSGLVDGDRSRPELPPMTLHVASVHIERDRPSNFVSLLTAVGRAHARARAAPVCSVDDLLRMFNTPGAGAKPFLNLEGRGRHLIHSMMCIATAGDAALAAVLGFWETIASNTDKYKWAQAHGLVLQAVSQEELPAASRGFRAIFLPETKPLLSQVLLGRRRDVTPLISMSYLCRFGDHAVVRGALPEVFTFLIVVFYEIGFETRVYLWAFHLAVAALDSAMAHGMEVPWSVVSHVLWAARRALGLPQFVHPVAPPSSQGSDSSSSDDSDDDPSDVDVEIAMGDRSSHVKMMNRLAIAATLAVAEWMHHSCHVVFPCETVHRQGMSVVRTVSGSFDVVAREVHAHGPHPYSAAAMTVTSVAHWLMDIEPHSAFSYPGDVVYQATSALWDRVVRWAIDPSLNAALLSHLPFEREALLQRIAPSTYLSPWAEAAVQEALHPFHRAQPPRKRCR